MERDLPERVEQEVIDSTFTDNTVLEPSFIPKKSEDDKNEPEMISLKQKLKLSITHKKKKRFCGIL